MISEIISIAISFIVTFLTTPIFIKFLYAAGIVGIDMHKKNKPRLPSAGGICVACGVLAGLLAYVGIKTFVYGLQTRSIPFLAIISSVLIVTLVGLFDDLNVKSKLSKEKGNYDIRVGLPQWLKPLLTLPAAIPLMVISAGETSVSIPFLGTVNFDIFYPLLVIPIGVVGASNMINLLGGFNGIEAGMGIVYMLSLGIYALLHGSIAAVIFLVSFASLLGFIRYNWYPAKILPGDSLTYLLGSLVAAGVIVGNMERVGIVVLTPFIIEFFLKIRSKFKASCLGKLRKDLKLDPPYGKKIYSLTHVIMNLGKFYEYQVTLIMILIITIFSIIPFLGIV
jgi:UDP-N-acetylglucosamine--dolichyl-phosphate N-acetylglucosaminephosphotransferase